MNCWLKLTIARKIAAELQTEYCGQPASVENHMVAKLWLHPYTTGDMWLNVNVDDFGNIGWVQVGTDMGLVPR